MNFRVVCALALLSAAVHASEMPPWPATTLPFRLVNSETVDKYLPATMPGGVAVFDYDGDALLDLFFPNGGDLPSGKKSLPAQGNRLFRNRGKMQFEDVTALSGLGGREYSFGAAVADYDGDGRPDILLSHLHGVTLYRNNGNGTFTDVTRRAGIDNKGRWSVGAAWFDADGDGDLDLYIVNYVHWDPSKKPECKTAGRADFCHPRYYDPQPGALFRNEGSGTFTDISEESGIGRHLGKGMTAIAADFNKDGKLDLFVTNDRLPAFFFRNTGGGKFEEAGFESGVAVPADGKPVSGMGADAQDVDGDGWPDLVYSALKDETFPFYRGSSNGFDDATASSRVGPVSRPFAGWGIQFADLDNDGRLDIVAASSDALSGKVDASRKGPIVWLRNKGDGKFEDAQTLAPPAMYRGLVAADLDRDGCLDLVVTALDSAAKVLRNPCIRKEGGSKRKWLGSSATGYASSLWEENPRP